MSAQASLEHEPRTPTERGPDRRRNSRSGRRAGDPHVSDWHWRRAAWLFAGYVAYVSLRSLPSTIGRWFKRPRS